MKRRELLSLLLAAPGLQGALGGLPNPFFIFDNGLGRGALPLDRQAELAKTGGYDGILFTGTAHIPEMRKSLEARGLKMFGIYTGMNLSDPKPAFDPGLPEAIRELKGSGAAITFTVNGKHADAEAITVGTLREVAGMAAESGLQVAMYPHYGMYIARLEDAVRVRAAVALPNLKIIFNLCHWLRSGDEANLDRRLHDVTPHLAMVNINGSDHEGDWNRLIQTLDQGDYNVYAFLKAVLATGYRGPIGLQCYNIKGDIEENLTRSMTAWKKLVARLV